MGLFDLFKKRPAVAAAVPDVAAAPARPVPDASTEEGRAGAAATPEHTPRQQSSIRSALNRTRAFLTTAFTTNVDALADDDFYDELSDGLLRADVGGELSASLVAQ